MREVKEKSPLKERAAKTLKSAPQAAFRRGTDASFQQLRQELRDAAQGGQPEDRYESGKITDTADHAVQEVRHLAEKAAHRLPKTKSEPQREARTESVPQHEQPRHPLQPTAAPREYPPQSQSQGNQSVRESASPIREKPVSPVNVQQPKKQVEALKTAARQPKERNNCNLTQLSATKSTLAEQRPFGHAPVVKKPAMPATAPTVQPSARTLPKEKTPFSSLREIPAALKPDTTQFALSEIKTKEYIRSRRQKQHLLKEEASSIENTIADSETFSPVIRTRETVREQQKLHVSHTVEEEALHGAVVRALNRFHAEDESTYLALMKATIGEAIGINGGSEEIDLLTRRIDTLNKRMLDLVNETVAAGKDVESSEDEFKGISDQIEQLNRRIAAIQESIHKDGSRQARLEEIQNIIAERNANETQYDDSIVRQMIECIKVHNDGKLTIIFGGGYEIEETLYPCRSAHSFAEINEISSFAVGGSSIQYARSSRLRPFCQMSLAARFNARETASLVRFPVRLRTSLQMKCIFGIFG